MEMSLIGISIFMGDRPYICIRCVTLYFYLVSFHCQENVACACQISTLKIYNHGIRKLIFKIHAY